MIDIKKFFSAIVFLVFTSCCVSATELDVFQVGQANFTILKSGDSALIIDFGFGSGRGRDNEWLERSLPSEEEWERIAGVIPERFIPACTKNDCLPKEKQDLLIPILGVDVKNITMVVSHDHSDHKNLAVALVRFLISKGKAIKFIGTTDWNINLAFDTMFEGLRNLTSSLSSSGIQVVPIISGISPIKSPHDKCLTLKVTTAAKVSFLLPGDSKGSTLKNMHAFFSDGGLVEVKDAMEFLSDVQVFLLSHHGSSNEYAIKWFDAVNSIYAIGGESPLSLSQQNPSTGDIEANPKTELILQTVVENPLYTLARKSEVPLLSIISSSSVGADKIPTVETVQNIILKSMGTRKLENEGRLFCCNHSVSCHFDGVSGVSEIDHYKRIPAFNYVTGSISPVFSTEDARDFDGDGAYRILAMETGDIVMYNRRPDVGHPLFLFSKSVPVEISERLTQQIQQYHSLFIEQDKAHGDLTEQLKRVWAGLLENIGESAPYLQDKMQLGEVLSGFYGIKRQNELRIRAALLEQFLLGRFETNVKILQKLSQMEID